MHHITTGSLPRAARLFALAATLLSACTTPAPAPEPSRSAPTITSMKTLLPCGGPSQPSCEAVGLSAMRLGPWYDLNRAAVAFEQGCTADTPEPNACVRLAYLRLFPNIKASNEEAGTIALQQRCQQGVSLACTLLGDDLRRYDNFEADLRDDALRWYRLALQHDPKNLHARAALLHIQGWKPGDEAGRAQVERQCLTLCSANTMLGCECAATAKLADPKTPERERIATARKLATRGCDGDLPSACRVAARVTAMAIWTDTASWHDVATLARRGCQGGDADMPACTWQAGAAILSRDGLTRDIKEGLAVSASSCKDGAPVACAFLAVGRLTTGQGDFYQPATVACIQHGVRCGHIAWALIESLQRLPEGSVEEQRRRVRLADTCARRACASLAEPAKMCRLASYILVSGDEANGWVSRDLATAHTLATRGCARGDGGSCDLLTTIATIQKLPVEQIAAPSCRACTLDPDSCLQWAARHLGAPDTFTCPSLSPATLQTACDATSADACVTLGLLAERGYLVKADAARAAALYHKACTRGQTLGCTQHLSLAVAKHIPVSAHVIEDIERDCRANSQLSCVLLGTWLADAESRKAFGVSATLLTPDPARGVKLLKGACASGKALGCKSLRHLCESGQRDACPSPKAPEPSPAAPR